MNERGYLGDFLQYISSTKVSYIEMSFYIAGSTLYGAGQVGILGMLGVYVAGSLLSFLIAETTK